jgi:hypothetical protein
METDKTALKQLQRQPRKYCKESRTRKIWKLVVSWVWKLLKDPLCRSSVVFRVTLEYESDAGRGDCYKRFGPVVDVLKQTS